ncbi:MAG: hypothetical protein HY553_21320 [Elusimicrobia bacterium]|nr:hypothetical protein [Elusimicrobiota bacterium]
MGFAVPAGAGEIGFRYTVAGGRLEIKNEGNEAAFFPRAFALTGGGWRELAPAGPAALPAGEAYRVGFRPGRRGLEALRGVLMRFFDQAGADFGLIAFLSPPPEETRPLDARYEDGRLVLRPPGDRRVLATWVLGSRESGIEATAKPVRFDEARPVAERVEWTAGSGPARLDLGDALPPAVLLHETERGPTLQHVRRGKPKTRPRPAWCDAGKTMLRAALACASVGWAWLAWILVGPASSRPRPSRAVSEPGAWLDVAVAAGGGALVASALGVRFLNSANWPTGGDTGSHLLYAYLYAERLLPSGLLLPWLPEVFGGFPFLSYYFPLPFLLMAGLSAFTGVAAAFKWGAFLACMALPGAVFSASRRWLGFSGPASLLGAVGALGYLLHEQNSIWGGNLLSTLSGEFTYSYGVLFGLLSLLAWSRALGRGHGWALPALLEAASGFSHAFPLLVVGCSTWLMALDALAAPAGRRRERLGRAAALLLKGHTAAFALLGGWLWPMLEMHSLTIPNDAAFTVAGWRDLLPEAIQPMLEAAAAGVALLAFPSVRRAWGETQRRAASHLLTAAALAAVGFIAGDRLGVADIRFFPLVWLFASIPCGWAAGQAVASLGGSPGDRYRGPRLLFVAMLATLWLRTIGAQVSRAPDWGFWNHSGLDAKPQWANLARLFPAMRGGPWSPRLLFEHDPDNHDVGSTRSLEALPMFLDGTPVLEGLYMESALLGPAVYQVQSEVSARPSSPLVRFPSGSLDAPFAAEHMRFLHSATVLLRSDKAKRAVRESGEFVRVGEASPFALFRLKRFDSRLASVVTRPLKSLPLEGWMDDAYAWFRSRSRFAAHLPVYGAEALPEPAPPPAPPVLERVLSRHELVFETEVPGRPHLIKVAYHPRWRLASKGRLHVAGPGFMLVVPEGREIRLVYGHTWAGRLGMAATPLAAIVLAWALWRGRRREAEQPAPSGSAARRWAPAAAVWVASAFAGAYFLWRSPERVYRDAWRHMRADRHAEASRRFALAYSLRRPPAKREEALFWWAKAEELSGRRAEAKARYRELFEKFHGYWVPESLYTYAHLSELDGDAAAAAPAWRRLDAEHPANPWTLRPRR